MPQVAPGEHVAPSAHVTPPLDEQGPHWKAPFAQEQHTAVVAPPGSALSALVIGAALPGSLEGSRAPASAAAVPPPPVEVPPPLVAPASALPLSIAAAP
jgi:hypothetical protein